MPPIGIKPPTVRHKLKVVRRRQAKQVARSTAPRGKSHQIVRVTREKPKPAPKPVQHVAPQHSQVFGPISRQDKPLKPQQQHAARKVKRARKKLPQPSSMERYEAKVRRGTKKLENHIIGDVVQRAKSGKSFNPTKLDVAINAGEAKGIKKVGGQYVKEHHTLLGGLLGISDPITLDPKRGGATRKIEDTRAARKVQLASSPTLAAGAKVIEATTRPSHAVASLAAGHGLKGAAKALEGKDKTTFKDVLEKHGVHGVASDVGGFIGDVALDPTTYLTLGAGKAGQIALESAAKKATKEALAKGASKKAADRAGRAAALKVIKSGKHEARGVSVGARVHVPLTHKTVDIKTSGRATAAVARKLPTRKARESKVVQGVGKTLAPDFRPAERTPTQHRVVRKAQREHRATVQSSRQQIRRKMTAVDRLLKSPEEHQRVIDAIEADRVRDLPERLQAAARSIRHDLDVAHQEGRKRNVEIPKFKPQSEDDARKYFPHTRKQDLEPGAKKHAGKGGATKVTQSKGRTIRKPLAKVREESPNLFSENVPQVVGAKLQRESERHSLHDFWRKVAKTGQPLTRKTELAGDDMVYKVEPSGLTALAKDNGERVDLDKVRAALKDRTGRYIVLNRRTVDQIKGSLGNVASSADNEFLHAYDRMQGALKKAFTLPSPSYHLRNLFGDTVMAFEGDATLRAFQLAGRAMKARAERNIAEASPKRFTHGKQIPDLNRRIKLGKAGETTIGRELKLAEKHGAIGTGFIGRELADLTSRKGRLSRALQYREDWPRMASYLSARARGLSPSDAADWSLSHHFDYQDLTTFERQIGRRVVPFWTFYARNTRLQATKVLTRPGKIATFGKVLNDTAKAAGFSSYQNYASNLEDYEQRGLPIPLKWGGQVYNLQAGLPLTDLNQLSVNPQVLVQDVANRVTFYKTVFELLSSPEGYSIFFQDKIEPKDAPLTRAPDEVRYLPGPMKRILGVTHDWKDPQTGKKAWAWRKKADYAVRSLPMGGLVLQNLLPERGTRNQTAAQTRLGFLTGVKVTPLRTAARSYKNVQENITDVENSMSKMRRAGDAVGKDGYYTKPYLKLLDQHAVLLKQRDKLAPKVGYTPSVQGRRPPLSPGEKLRKQIEEIKHPSKSPQQQLQDEIRSLRNSVGVR